MKVIILTILSFIFGGIVGYQLKSYNLNNQIIHYEKVKDVQRNEKNNQFFNLNDLNN